ncbi:hypothetical protein V6N12_057424 [Hibiscus sabdariffa]|uniref:Uncharacterized protein n=1 Tax=Hibiscus sabdariffa TaxID=183260 RepID=A0ABR2C517_9ROSI
MKFIYGSASYWINNSFGPDTSNSEQRSSQEGPYSIVFTLRIGSICGGYCTLGIFVSNYVLWQLWKRRCGMVMDDNFVDQGDLTSRCQRLAIELSVNAATRLGMLSVRARQWIGIELNQCMVVLKLTSMVHVKEWNVTILCIPRSMNKGTNSLATFKRNQPVGVSLFYNPSEFVMSLVNMEK